MRIKMTVKEYYAMMSEKKPLSAFNDKSFTLGQRIIVQKPIKRKDAVHEHQNFIKKLSDCPHVGT